MVIDILTLFPNMFDGFLSESIIKRAIEDKKVTINIHNFRDYSLDPHHNVDDYSYGGGAGMVLMPQPIFDCVEHLKTPDSKVIILTPAGLKYEQKMAYDLSQYKDILTSYNLETDLSTISGDSDLTTLESTVNSYISQIQLDQQDAQTSRMDEENSAKLIWEDELEMLEDEVGEEETQLELEQTDIETQMEYISNELQSINDAASKEMQGTVIKLS